MNFKKYNEMELALLASIASMDEEDVENISMEKGDISPVTSRYCTTPVPRYAYKLGKSGITEDMMADINIISFRHAAERKKFFHKREMRKSRIKKLNYDTSKLSKRQQGKLGEDSDILSAAHSDRCYFRGNKAERKNWTVREEMRLMEQEELEQAREAMMEEHNSIIGAVMQDIDTLTLDMKCNDYSIENLKMEYKELEEAMKLVSEKLQNAKLRRNGIMAALLSNESELDTLSTKLTKERISRFGW